MKYIFDKNSLICEEIKQVNNFARNFYFSDNLEREESQLGATICGFTKQPNVIYKLCPHIISWIGF